MTKQAATQTQGIQELNNDPMMAHLIQSLESGKDIGHYGRLVFVMVGRHFLGEDELVGFLTKDKDCDETKARSLVNQVNAHDYNPPRRERIIEWMKQQGFEICPDSGSPDACNVYKHLAFPEKIYENISGYQAAKVETNSAKS